MFSTSKLTLSTLFMIAAMIANARADVIDGPYIGLGLGSNTSSATTLSNKTQLYPNWKAGYNWTRSGFLLGAEGFVDSHPRIDGVSLGSMRIDGGSLD